MDRYRFSSIFILTLMAALGTALALPEAVGLTGLAAEGVFNQAGAPEVGTRYYVAETGNNSTGSSWDTAFKKFQDALDAAGSGD